MNTVETIKLRNASLATSSAKGGYLDEHLSHIFEPRTGNKKPQFISASVVHERAEMADALATAYTLMGGGDSIRKIWRSTGAKYISAWCAKTAILFALVNLRLETCLSQDVHADGGVFALQCST